MPGSGVGITDAVNGTFDPAVAGVGTHTITYQITGRKRLYRSRY